MRVKFQLGKLILPEDLKGVNLSTAAQDKKVARLKLIFSGVKSLEDAEVFDRIANEVAAYLAGGYPSFVNSVKAKLSKYRRSIMTFDATESLLYELANSAPGKMDSTTCLKSWCVLRVVKVTPVRGQGKFVNDYEFLATKGRHAGTRFIVRMSPKGGKAMSRHIGFSYKAENLRYEHSGSLFFADMLIGLEVGCVVAPAHDALQIESYGVSNSQKARNRKIIKSRHSGCDLLGLKEQRCLSCAKGRDVCPAACRSVTLKQKECPVCLETTIWAGDDTCLNCVRLNKR